jgi:major intracellular serine protease
MKFSALTFALAAASSATTASAFGVTRPAYSFKSVAIQMSVDGSLDHGSTPPMVILDDADEAEAKIPAYTRKESTGFSKKSKLPLGIRLTGGEKLREDGLTGKGVKVAVIDSGVAAGHPGFGDKVVKQIWLSKGGSLMKYDHGTHVAGTIHMMAPEAEIYDYRVFGNRGMGVNEAIITAIYDAIEEGCDIINMSIGSPMPGLDIYKAVRAAYKAGLIMVVAAGNEGDGDVLTNENSWPANYSQCINVAAVAKRNKLPVARFSNTNDQVDYCGIGVDVKSFHPDGTFHKMDGTSMATPHVCGFLTALLTKGGKYEDIITDDNSCRKLINKKFCIDVGAEGSDNATGLGFLTYLTKEEFEEDFLNLPDY